MTIEQFRKRLLGLALAATGDDIYAIDTEASRVELGKSKTVGRFISVLNNDFGFDAPSIVALLVEAAIPDMTGKEARMEIQGCPTHFDT